LIDPPGEHPVRWSAAPDATAAGLAHDFGALGADGVARVPVSTRTAEGAGDDAPPERLDQPALSSRGVGTLVHRILGLAHRRDTAGEEGLARVADEVVATPGTLELTPAERRNAAVIAARLQAAGELRAQAGARLLFEVPYSRRLDDGRVERGVVDCLAVGDDAVEVLEFKTGAAQAEHGAQLEAYVAAVAAAYPAHRVTGRLLYVQLP
jgi:hypothetical protein